MNESPLDRIVRLAAVPVRQYQRMTSRGRVTTVHQYQQQRATGQQRLGTPYRISWNNVQVGDVLEFGNELWKVITAQSYPGYKPPTSSGKKTGSGTTTGSGVTTGTGSGGTSGVGTSQSGGTQVYTQYLQNYRDHTKYDKLTLPSNFVVSVVPVLP